MKAKFETLVPKYKEAYARAEIRRNKFRDRLIFWTNFSRVFVKWVMNIAYVALVLFMIYGIYWMTRPAIDFFKWFLTFDSIPLILFVAKIFAVVALVFVVIYLLPKAFKTCAETAVKAGAYVAMPATLMANIVCAPGRWIAQGWLKTTEFISIFYEENCPPVTIISEEEEKIEEVANNG